MKKWKFTALGLLATIAVAPSLYAQIPDGTAATATSAASAAPTKNIWSMFCMTPDQAAKCKDKLCNSPLGMMLTSAAKPMTLMSGGLLFSKCGVPTADDLKKLDPASAEGAAAAIKKDEAEAKARREAMRYLGTVDCNWWPAARDALCAGLRNDRNECVRYEAALSLLRGCCCNKETMKALKDCANGNRDDGNPPENSWRVRQVAAEALAHCAEIYVEPGKPAEEKQKEAVPPPQASMHGKGLMGILASAAVNPPSANVPVKSVAPAPMAQKDQTVASTAPAQQWNVVPKQEKKGLFQRIDWGSHNANYQAKESKSLEPTNSTALETSVTPVNYGPVPVNYGPVPPIQNTGPFNTSAGNNYNPTFVPMRPGEETMLPTRGTVIFDGGR